MQLSSLEESMLHNIMDMGLEFSAMIRLFGKGSKEGFRKKILSETKK